MASPEISKSATVRSSYYDYIRAFAALLVLFCHKGKMPGGSIGVSIFFCLSGFLITRILIGLPSLSASNLAKFIFRRFMRIYPLYVASIAVIVFLAWLFRPEWFPTIVDGVPGMLTFTYIPGGTGFATSVGWTLHAEFWFYLFFPMIFALTYNRGLLPTAIGMMVVASILAKTFFGINQRASWPIANNLWLTVIYLDQFMYGVICALLIAKRSSLLRLFSSKYWFWGGLVINLLVGKLVHLEAYDFIWYSATSGAALICGVAILHHDAIKAELKDSFFAWIGRISFSIYLFHAIIRDYYYPFAENIPDVLDTPVFVVAVLIVSSFTERFIERPGIRLAKSLTKFRPSRRVQRLAPLQNSAEA
jgi:peptidoglycan/LPS O-acetylase OafA/YrhL